MKQDRRIAGIGGIVFAVVLIVSIVVASPPGGEYDAADVADFVAKGHRSAVIVSLYLMLLSVLGLLVMMSYLRDSALGTGRHGRMFWGLAVAAATSFFAGWLILLTPAESKSIGGGPSIDPAVAYTFMQAGWGVALVGGGALLGCALLILAFAGHGAPTWVRALGGIAGLLGVASAAFFPFFALILFGLIVGLWLLVSKEPDAAAAV